MGTMLFVCLLVCVCVVVRAVVLVALARGGDVRAVLKVPWLVTFALDARAKPADREALPPRRLDE
jgi:hypothetical protein